MKTAIFLFLTLLLVIPGRSKVPLNKAIENGMKLSLEIVNNDIDSKIIGIDNKIRRSKRYFTIKGGGNYIYRSEKIELQFPDMVISPELSIPGQRVEGGVLHNFDVYISLFQPVFTGNVLKNVVRMGETEKLLNRDKKDLLRRLLAGKIKSVFLQYELLGSEKRSLELLRAKIDNHLDRQKDLYIEKLVGKSGILETEVRIGETDLKIEEVKSGMENVRVTFRELCGYDIEEVDGNNEISIPKKTEALELFMKNHPTMKIFQRRLNIAGIGKKITYGRNLPQIGGFMELHHGLPGFNIMGDSWTTYFQAGIKIGLNIFDWGKAKRESKISDYKIEKINKEKNDLIRKTGFRLQSLYKNLTSLNKMLATAKKMADISIEESGLKNMMFSEKQISNREYLDSVFNSENIGSLCNRIKLRIDLIKVEINSLVEEQGVR